jgi:hypothetical protein
VLQTNLKAKESNEATKQKTNSVAPGPQPNYTDMNDNYGSEYGDNIEEGSEDVLNQELIIDVHF